MGSIQRVGDSCNSGLYAAYVDLSLTEILLNFLSPSSIKGYLFKSSVFAVFELTDITERYQISDLKT